MTISQIKEHFYVEIKEIYTRDEAKELFVIFSQKILNLDKISLHLSAEKIISEDEKNEFLRVILELKTGKPYQHILGKAYFYGDVFFVNENVLIPRPETEELIEIIQTKLKDLRDKNLKILDIGTGSGCIPISLAKIFRNAEITSIDISEKALEIAKKNAEFHRVKINFIQKDYLTKNLTEIYDIIVSNPPYIDTSEESEISFSVKNFEPNIALFAPKNRTLAFYEKIAQDSESNLAQNGFIFLEINQKLGKETLALFKNKLATSELLKDLSQNDRFIIGQK